MKVWNRAWIPIKVKGEDKSPIIRPTLYRPGSWTAAGISAHGFAGHEDHLFEGTQASLPPDGRHLLSERFLHRNAD